MMTTRHSLNGQPVLITRPPAQAAGLETLLRAAGARPWLCPMLEIAWLWQPLCPHLPHMAGFEWLVVSSQNAVHALARALQAEQRDPVQTLAGPELAAVGPQTAAALAALSGRPVHQPPRADAEHLANALIQARIEDRKVLYLRGRQARPLLPERLRAAGADLSELVVYESGPPSEQTRPRLQQWLSANPHAHLTFASPSAVAHFAALVPEWRHLAPRAQVVTIGPVTAAAAQAQLGQVDAVAPEAGDRGLLSALAELHHV
jgi:uroporphyrinogen-III synthase